MKGRERQAARRTASGFTLLEILLSVGLLSVLAGIIVIAINPAKQLAEARNVQRRADVNSILNAVYQHAIDNNGLVAASIPSSATCPAPATNEICRTGGTCTGLVDLAVLTDNQKYITSMAADPTGATTNGSGYFIAKNVNGRVIVCAPSAEQGATISVIR